MFMQSNLESQIELDIDQRMSHQATVCLPGWRVASAAPELYTISVITKMQRLEMAHYLYSRNYYYYIFCNIKESKCVFSPRIKKK